MQDSTSQVDGPEDGGKRCSASNALKIYCRIRRVDDDLTEHECCDGMPERKTDTIVALRRGIIEQQYLFEHVFDKDDSQRDVFQRTAQPMIESLLAGQDGLIFAYGATGSGKSFTVGGLPHNPGLVPRTIDYLFKVLAPHLNRQFIIQPDYQNHFIVNDRFSDGELASQEISPDMSLCLGVSDRKRYVYFITLTFFHSTNLYFFSLQVPSIGSRVVRTSQRHLQ